MPKTKKEFAAYKSGYNNGLYGFNYIHPDYSQSELREWANGYKKGKIKGEKQNEKNN